MKIIIEGPDGSGKSTLAEELAKAMGLRIQKGEGPEKYPGEIEERANRWNSMLSSEESLIFDRHPCISHPIYSAFTPVTQMSKRPIVDFYRQLIESHRHSIVIVNCQGHDLEDHKAKEYDSEAHLASVKRHHSSICKAYEIWGSQWAWCHYDRSKNDLKLTTRLIKEYLSL